MLKPFFIKKKNIDNRLVPVVSAADAGKVLGVTEDGKIAAVEAGGGGGSDGGLAKIVGTIYFVGGSASIPANSVGTIRVSDDEYTINGAYDYNNEEIPGLADKLNSGLYSIIFYKSSLGNDLYLLGCNTDGKTTYILNSTSSPQSVANLDWAGILIRNYES